MVVTDGVSRSRGVAYSEACVPAAALGVVSIPPVNPRLPCLFPSALYLYRRFPHPLFSANLLPRVLHLAGAY